MQRARTRAPTSRLRATLKGLLILGLTLVFYLIWLLGAVLVLPFRRLYCRWRWTFFRTWGRSVCRAMGVSVDVRGAPPRAPCFLVCNHLSYLDIPLIAGYFDGVFVAKAEVAAWPVMGPLARTMRTIFVNRQSKRDVLRVNRRIEQALERGEGVVVFPEGTSSGGEEVLPFRPALLEPAAASRHPAHYASLAYRTPPGCPPAATAVCWWGDMTFFGHLWGMLALPGFDAVLHFGGEALHESDRKLLAERLHRAVSRQRGPA